jgi:hypothetical protein
MMKSLSSAVILALMLASTAIAQAISISLPALGADERGTSVSALPSGALMAVPYQVAFAYSNPVVGAGVAAGGPYYCAAGALHDAAVCKGQVSFMPNVALMAVAAAGYAESGQIGPPSSLQNNRIDVFSGTKDTLPYPQAEDAAASLHVAFHCCKQSAAIVKDDSYAKTSHNNWTDPNDIIMLYPQVCPFPLYRLPGAVSSSGFARSVLQDGRWIGD